MIIVIDCLPVATVARDSIQSTNVVDPVDVSVLCKVLGQFPRLP